MEDVRWLTGYDLQWGEAVAESAQLRTLVDNFNKEGSPLLQLDTTAGTRGALMKQVSDVLDQAKSFVTSRDLTPPSAARPKAE